MTIARSKSGPEFVLEAGRTFFHQSRNKMLDVLARRRVYHRPYRELSELSDRDLNDLGMGTFYRLRHELIFVFKKGTSAHINNFELGQHGRYRTNVWEYRGVNSRHGNRMKEPALHPTVKPVQMNADAIRQFQGAATWVEKQATYAQRGTPQRYNTRRGLPRLHSARRRPECDSSNGAGSDACPGCQCSHGSTPVSAFVRGTLGVNGTRKQANVG